MNGNPKYIDKHKVCAFESSSLFIILTKPLRILDLKEGDYVRVEAYDESIIISKIIEEPAERHWKEGDLKLTKKSLPVLQSC